jgi:hypothetical protein
VARHCEAGAAVRAPDLCRVCLGVCGNAADDFAEKVAGIYQAVRRVVDAVYEPGAKVWEVGCGIGGADERERRYHFRIWRAELFSIASFADGSYFRSLRITVRDRRY